jgi:uncharacterized protein (DUF58 family)
VDWNVFARTERMYLKRYRGETNTQLSILLDASRSMKFGSHSVGKLDYAQFLAASLAYMAHMQRDAVGLIVFDDEVRRFVQPSSRQGQLHRLLHAIEEAKPGHAHRFRETLPHADRFSAPAQRGGRDFRFLGEPRDDYQHHGAAALRGNEVILFHVLDPDELRPKLKAAGAVRGSGERRNHRSLARFSGARVSRQDRWAR